MLLHVQDALQQGHKKILLRTVDTDVLVLTVAFLQQVTEGEHLDLWVAFGTGHIFRYRALNAIPPTRAALVEHAKRATYQAGHCWGQALVPSPVLPSPQEWGWTMGDGIWKPFWTTLPDVTKSCQELVRCGCKKGCQGRCSCTKAGLRCTALCTCTDDCHNT